MTQQLTTGDYIYQGDAGVVELGSQLEIVLDSVVATDDLEHVSMRSRPTALSRSVVATMLVTVMLGVFAFTAGTGAAATGTPTNRTSAGEQYDSNEKVITPKPVVKGVSVVKGASVTKTASSSPASVPTTASGQLPFTGVSLLGVVVIGFGMVGVGIMLLRQRHDRT